MNRLLFEKMGDAVWISHLDLMRLMQRAFQRAHLHLTHTQGFTPRPSVSIALPLSVGVESRCELLDFELEEKLPEDLVDKLNRVLISGVTVRDVYTGGRKLRELTHMRCRISLIYDRGVTAGAEEAISEMLGRESLIVEKKSKNGVSQQDIAPMISDWEFQHNGERALELTCTVCCQNPTLNPTQVVAAIEKYLPEYRPDFHRCCRLELFDSQGEIFR